MDLCYLLCNVDKWSGLRSREVARFADDTKLSKTVKAKADCKELLELSKPVKRTTN